MNKVELQGTVGNVYDVKHFSTGNKKREFSLGTRYQKKDGSYGPYDWHNVVVWGDMADGISPMKGQTYLVKGSIRTESWEKNGEKKYKTVITAQSVEQVHTNEQIVEKAQALKAQLTPQTSPSSFAMDSTMTEEDVPF